MAAQIKAVVARVLARRDPDRAEKVADSIVDAPIARSAALFTVADALPVEARDRKLALLACAAVHAREAKSPAAEARVAFRLFKLGEKEKAKSLGAEAVASAKADPRIRRSIAFMLAPIDPPAALSIAGELAASSRQTANEILWNVAIGLAVDNPAEAERVLRLVPQEAGESWLHPAIARKMAMSDPARARRLVDESQQYYVSPQSHLYLASGLKARDPAAADEAFWKGIREIDRLLEQGAESLTMQVEGGSAALLPLAEQIDPTLVPELFWRAIAARPPIGDPRLLNDDSSSELVALLSWYNRDVASVVFELVRTLMEQTDDRELASAWRTQFEAGR